jgi:hypothetical protein
MTARIATIIWRICAIITRTVCVNHLVTHELALTRAAPPIAVSTSRQASLAHRRGFRSSVLTHLVPTAMRRHQLIQNSLFAPLGLLPDLAPTGQQHPRHSKIGAPSASTWKVVRHASLTSHHHLALQRYETLVATLLLFPIGSPFCYPLVTLDSTCILLAAYLCILHPFAQGPFCLWFPGCF